MDTMTTLRHLVEVMMDEEKAAQLIAAVENRPAIKELVADAQNMAEDLKEKLDELKRASEGPDRIKKTRYVLVALTHFIGANNNIIKQISKDRLSSLSDPQALINDAENIARDALQQLYSHLQTKLNNGDDLDETDLYFADMTGESPKLYADHAYEYLMGYNDVDPLSGSFLEAHYELMAERWPNHLDKLNDAILNEIAKIAPGSPLEKRVPVPAIKTYGIAIDKISRSIVKPQNTENGWAVNIAGKGGKNQAIVFLTLTSNGVPQNIDAFDLAVINAISTLHYARTSESKKGITHLTPDDIWRTMTHQLDNQHANPSPNQKKQVQESVEKMRHADYEKDVTEDAQKYLKKYNKQENVKSWKRRTAFLNATVDTVTTSKGRPLVVYTIKEMPPLYQDALQLGQVLALPYYLLGTPDAGNDRETIIFKNYFLREIGLMKKRQASKNPISRGHKTYGRDSTTMLFDTMYKDIGMQPPQERFDSANADANASAYMRREAQKDRRKIEGLLKSWESMEWIAGFSWRKQGKRFIGVDIDLDIKTERPEQL